MKSPKPAKRYAEIEEAFFAEIDKLDKGKLKFEAKQEKERLDFLTKYEKKKFKITKKYEAAIAACDEPPPPLGIMVQHDPNNLGEY